MRGQFDLLSSPFACDIEIASEQLQMVLRVFLAKNFLAATLAQQKFQK